MSNHLSDKDFSELYFDFSQKYKALTTNLLSIDSETISIIYAQLWNELFARATNPNNKLSKLTYEQKQEAFKILDVFIGSLPVKNASFEDIKNLLFINIKTVEKIPAHLHYPKSNKSFLSTFIDGFFLGYLFSFSSNSNNKKNEAIKSALILFVLFITIICMALFAFYYVANLLFNGVERFVYNEGYLQATFTLSSTIASGIVAGLLGQFLASAPLMLLGASLGLANPVGLSIAAVVCLSFLGAALGGSLTNLIQDSLINNKNKDALVRKDPHRFKLTKSEMTNLEDNGFDVVKVKCGILEAWDTITDNNGVHDKGYRLFSRNGRKEQQNLNIVRALRAGDVEMLEGVKSVGNKLLNFAFTDAYTSCPPECHMVMNITGDQTVYIPDLDMSIGNREEVAQSTGEPVVVLRGGAFFQHQNSPVIYPPPPPFISPPFSPQLQADPPQQTFNPTPYYGGSPSGM